MTVDSGLQRASLGRVDGQGIGEAAQRLAVRGTAVAAFEGGDRGGAHSCPLRQCLTGEAGGMAVTPQQGAKCRRLVRDDHCLAFLTAYCSTTSRTCDACIVHRSLPGPVKAADRVRVRGNSEEIAA